MENVEDFLEKYKETVIDKLPLTAEEKKENALFNLYASLIEQQIETINDLYAELKIAFQKYYRNHCSDCVDMNFLLMLTYLQKSMEELANILKNVSSYHFKDFPGLKSLYQTKAQMYEAERDNWKKLISGEALMMLRKQGKVEFYSHDFQQIETRSDKLYQTFMQTTAPFRIVTNKKVCSIMKKREYTIKEDNIDKLDTKAIFSEIQSIKDRRLAIQMATKRLDLIQNIFESL